MVSLDMTKNAQSSLNLEVAQAQRQVALLQQYQNAATDEARAKIRSELCVETQGLLDNNPVDLVITRLQEAIAKDTFRPRNMTLQQFVRFPDFKYVNGEFSTFDPELSRQANGGMSPYELRRHLNKNKVNRTGVFSVVDQYIADWVELIAKYPDERAIVTDSGADGDIALYDEYCCRLARKMRDKMGIKHHLVVRVFDSWQNAHDTTGLDITDARSTSCGFCWWGRIERPEKDKGKPCCVIYLNRQTLYKKLQELTKTSTKTGLYNEIMGCLAHEFAHFVDGAAPNKGSLGAQIAHIANRIRVSPVNAADPTAYTIAVDEAFCRTVQKYLMEELQKTR